MWLGRHKVTGKDFAVKRVNDDPSADVKSNIKAIINEANILREIDHKHVIKLEEHNVKGQFISREGETSQ